MIHDQTPNDLDEPRFLLLAVGRVRWPEDVPAEAAKAGQSRLIRLVRAPDAVGAMIAMKRQIRAGRRFDLILVGTRLADEPDPWRFITALRGAWPWQPWALSAAAGEATPAAERYALTQGALGVFDTDTEFELMLTLLSCSREMGAASASSSESSL